jgi:ATP-dependent Clp protease ATP-binding subunit ClpA
MTHKSQEALQRAAGLAREKSHPEVGTTHLLLALLEQGDGVVLPLVQKLGVTPTALRNRTTELLATTMVESGRFGAFVRDPQRPIYRALRGKGKQWINAINNSTTSKKNTPFLPRHSAVESPHNRAGLLNQSVYYLGLIALGPECTLHNQ